MAENWYAVLGVKETATEKEITTAYRKGALKCHPDRFPNNKAASERFLRLSKAYEILSDPAQRRAIDEALKATVLKRKRDEEMDSKRKDLKSKLEKSEKTWEDIALGKETESERRVRQRKEETKLALEKKRQERAELEKQAAKREAAQVS